MEATKIESEDLRGNGGSASSSSGISDLKLHQQIWHQGNIIQQMLLSSKM